MAAAVAAEVARVSPLEGFQLLTRWNCLNHYRPVVDDAPKKHGPAASAVAAAAQVKAPSTVDA